MSRIRETVTALTAGKEPGAVHVTRKERAPMSDKRIAMILRCITRVSLIGSVTVLVIYAEIQNLLALIGFVFFFGLIYFSFRD